MRSPRRLSGPALRGRRRSATCAANTSWTRRASTSARPRLGWSSTPAGAARSRRPTRFSSRRPRRCWIGAQAISGTAARSNPPDSIQVAYQGLPLGSLRACYWKVCVWDRRGNASAWSEPAQWSMGILQARRLEGEVDRPGSRGRPRRQTRGLRRLPAPARPVAAQGVPRRKAGSAARRSATPGWAGPSSTSTGRGSETRCSRRP